MYSSSTTRSLGMYMLYLCRMSCMRLSLRRCCARILLVLEMLAFTASASMRTGLRCSCTHSLMLAICAKISLCSAYAIGVCRLRFAAKRWSESTYCSYPKTWPRSGDFRN